MFGLFVDGETTPHGHREHELLAELLVTTVRPAERDAVRGVLARGMRDNPTHLAVFGPDPLRRGRALERLFGALIGSMQLPMVAARRPDGTIVGVCGWLPPGRCRLPPAAQLRMLPHVLPLGLRTNARLMRWQRAWASQDPKEPHWHLGPVAVDAGMQRRGIGGLLLARFCARVDAAGEPAYLETDKPGNVRFYERFGFEVVGEREVLGAPNWFMWRAARPAR